MCVAGSHIGYHGDIYNIYRRTKLGVFYQDLLRSPYLTTRMVTCVLTQSLIVVCLQVVHWYRSQSRSWFGNEEVRNEGITS